MKGQAAGSANISLQLQLHERLLELVSEVAGTLDLTTLLKRTAEAAKELTGSESALLFLHDVESGHLTLEATTSSDAAGWDKLAIDPGRSVAGWVFKRGEFLRIEDAAHDVRFLHEADMISRSQTRSVLAVPVRVKQDTLGVLETINKPGGYSELDLELLQVLASQAAIAIQNKRLFEQCDLVEEMVHELRTPLTALTAAAHMLKRTDLGEDQKLKLASTIISEVQELAELSGNFLELSRLESGRARFAREPVHLGGLVGECLEVLRPQAAAESIVLQSSIDPTLIPVRGDRNLLRQLIMNLLTNAIKYNRPGGKVRVGVHAHGDEVLITVRDTGRGIPSEYLPHIFERFFRVPGEEGRASGFGLGLAICKKIAESHHGSVEVESKLGKGSSFTVHLPLDKSRAREAA